jgi:Rod binding domain-containing protein
MAGAILPAASALAAAPAPLRRAAESFEATALAEFLKPMFDTVDTAHGLFGGGSGEEAFKPMLIDEIARSMARAGGVGIAAHVLAALIGTQRATAGNGR